MKAVRFDHYGGLDVLEIREVEDPVPGPGQVLVAVKAAGINPGEIAIREGRLDERWPATFPSGEGTDLAGVVKTVGDGVTDFEAGDEVVGWTEERASQAELVTVPADQLTAKPTGCRGTSRVRCSSSASRARRPWTRWPRSPARP